MYYVPPGVPVIHGGVQSERGVYYFPLGVPLMRGGGDMNRTI